MTKEIFIELFDRELQKLLDEVKAYPQEENLWKTQGAIANSGGNLILHLVGNLRHFIGHGLGKTDYVRQRDLEFSQQHIPLKELEAAVLKTKEEVHEALSQMSEAQLEEDYPLEKRGEKVNARFMLCHLLTHLNYHLGQLNYHRRMYA